MKFDKQVLSNGLRVLTVPMNSFESATVLVMVKVGSRYETRKNSGIAHFFEHMAFKGTSNRPSSMDIASLIDGIGGEFNAFTGKEYTGYYIKAQKDHVALLLEVLSDMLNNSLLDSTEIEKEKGVILEEKNMYEDMPMRNIGDVYEGLLYGDTPLGWDTVGFKESILGVTREDFVDYMNGWYSPHNMTVVVAGGIETDSVVESVRKEFGSMKKHSVKSPVKVDDSQSKPSLKIKDKLTEQVHIALGVRTTELNNDDRRPLGLLASILGGGMSSRLFDDIREKRGLAYYVRSHSDHYEDCGTFVTTAGIDPKRIDEALEVTLEHYRRAGSGKLEITKDELNKAKEFSKGHLVLDLEDSKSVAIYYAHQELLMDKVNNPDQVIKEIDKITIDQIDEVGRKYFKTATLNLALIGKYSDGQKLEKILKL